MTRRKEKNRSTILKSRENFLSEDTTPVYEESSGGRGWPEEKKKPYYDFKIPRKFPKWGHNARTWIKLNNLSTCVGVVSSRRKFPWGFEPIFTNY